MKFFTLTLSIMISGIGFGQVTVYEEGFDNGIPAEWILIDNDGNTPHSTVSEYDAAWIKKARLDDATDTVASSTSYFEPAGTADRWLISPPIVLGSYGNALQWEAQSHDASFPDSYKVLISTTGTDMQDFTDTAGVIIQENADWTMRTVDLSELGINDATIHVAFVNITTDGFKLYLDNVTVSKDDPAATPFVEQDLWTFNKANSAYIEVLGKSPVEKIEVYSYQGKLIHTSGNNQFVRPAQKGVYLVRIYSENSVFVKKINL